jgi:hypothetical protein
MSDLKKNGTINYLLYSAGGGDFKKHSKQILMKTAYLLLIPTLGIMACSEQQTVSENTAIIIPDDRKELRQLLDSIHDVDQNYRKELTELYQEHGFESAQVQSLIPTIAQADSTNLAVVTAILDKHGWLGVDDVGTKANMTLFLVIQHANYDVQEKYLPMMQQAVKDGKASKQDLALLEDRVAIGRGDLQIYGSQIGMNKETGTMYVMPLKDPETVNERRISAGLDSMENYVSNWGMTWNVEVYKTELPEIIEVQKKQLAEEKKMGY